MSSKDTNSMVLVHFGGWDGYVCGSGIHFFHGFAHIKKAVEGSGAPVTLENLLLCWLVLCVEEGATFDV